MVTRFVEEFKNRANHDIVDELFTADFVHHLTDPRLPPGRDALKLLGQSIVAGFPDVQVTVEDLLVDGDKVIERTTARATHTGEFQRHPRDRQAGHVDRDSHIPPGRRKNRGTVV